MSNGLEPSNSRAYCFVFFFFLAFVQLFGARAQDAWGQIRELKTAKGEEIKMVVVHVKAGAEEEEPQLQLQAEFLYECSSSSAVDDVAESIADIHRLQSKILHSLSPFVRTRLLPRAFPGAAESHRDPALVALERAVSEAESYASKASEFSMVCLFFFFLIIILYVELLWREREFEIECYFRSRCCAIVSCRPVLSETTLRASREHSSLLNKRRPLGLIFNPYLVPVFFYVVLEFVPVYCVVQIYLCNLCSLLAHYACRR